MSLAIGRVRREKSVEKPLIRGDDDIRNERRETGMDDGWVIGSADE